MVHSENLIKVIRWVEMHDGEFIEHPSSGWHRDYLSFSEITQDELNELCDLFNDSIVSEYAIANLMGEIVLGTRKDYLIWKEEYGSGKG